MIFVYLLFVKVYILGPFLSPIREGAKDFLFLKGGEEKYVLNLTDTFYSPLSKKGVLLWKKSCFLDTYYIEIKSDTEEIKKEFFHHGYSFRPLYYIYIDTLIKEEGNYLFFVKGISKFYIDSLPYPGNPYYSYYLPIPVKLKKGEHRFIFLTGRIENRVEIRFKKAPVFPFVYKELCILPDIIVDSSYDFWTGILIINPTEKSYRDVFINGYGRNLYCYSKKINLILPYSIKYIPLKWRIVDPFEEDDVGNYININIEMKIGDTVRYFPLFCNIKNRHQPLKVTFLSNIDSSVQYFALRYPLDKGKKGVVFTLHGAGVEAINLVKSYRAKKDFFIVAPTNRRNFGFDWQDVGALDLKEVVEYVRKNFDVDTERFYLTGHSMGGHGVYYNSIYFPDLFAAFSPSAAWISFRLYVPYFLQMVNIFGPPENIYIREKILQMEEPQRYILNVLNKPFLIIHGEDDLSVPPFHPRFMYSIFREKKIKADYIEVSDKGHWWDLENTEGIDCIDSDTIFKFFKKYRNSGIPDSFVYYFLDMQIKNRIYFLELLEKEEKYRQTLIRFKKLKEDSFLISTENIYKFQINTYYFSSLPLGISIDGRYFVMDKRGYYVFKKVEGKWRMFYSKLKDIPKIKEIPLKNILFNKLFIVYAAKSNASYMNYHYALYLLYRLFLQGNFNINILPDTLFKAEYLTKGNFIFIGNIEDFSEDVKRILYEIPFDNFEDHISNSLLIFSYPSYPFSVNLNLFVLYPSVDFLKEAFRINFYSTSMGLPEILILKNRLNLRKQGFSALKMFIWDSCFEKFSY